jgi:hypothetical protein
LQSLTTGDEEEDGAISDRGVAAGDGVDEMVTDFMEGSGIGDIFEKVWMGGSGAGAGSDGVDGGQSGKGKGGAPETLVTPEDWSLTLTTGDEENAESSLPTTGPSLIVALSMALFTFIFYLPMRAMLLLMPLAPLQTQASPAPAVLAPAMSARSSRTIISRAIANDHLQRALNGMPS